jgi:hypothetical protein
MKNDVTFKFLERSFFFNIFFSWHIVIMFWKEKKIDSQLLIISLNMEIAQIQVKDKKHLFILVLQP